MCPDGGDVPDLEAEDIAVEIRGASGIGYPQMDVADTYLGVVGALTVSSSSLRGHSVWQFGDTSRSP